MKIYNYEILDDFEILNDLEDEELSFQEFNDTSYASNISEFDFMMDDPIDV